MIAERSGRTVSLDNFELLDYVLLPLALVTEYRVITWSLLSAAVLWLYYQHFSKSAVGTNAAIVVWRTLVAVAVVAVACVVFLLILSSRGADYYRVVLGAISAIPLVIPPLLCFLIRPRRERPDS